MARNLTHYQILDISRTATLQEIKSRFYALSRLLHPDVAPDRSPARFLKVAEAYTVLSNTKSRQAYDKTLEKEHGPTPKVSLHCKPPTPKPHLSTLNSAHQAFHQQIKLHFLKK